MTGIHSRPWYSVWSHGGNPKNHDAYLLTEGEWERIAKTSQSQSFSNLTSLKSHAKSNHLPSFQMIIGSSFLLLHPTCEGY